MRDLKSIGTKVGKIKYRSFAYIGRIRVVLNGSEAEVKDKSGEQGSGGGVTTQ
ncbi:hypothetical protein [Vulcanisaeta moutnovskia]|uniref:hypothetical protein n=1 Tax=Vulcanisaeta moutnovskia TaxID=985052 RepID=UPI0013050FD4|nr:hypothetical protein [Vulcanisaeta moutnovskia]